MAIAARKKKKPEHKICVNCGRGFMTVYRKKKCCCDSCRYAFWNTQNRRLGYSAKIRNLSSRLDRIEAHLNMGRES